METTGAVAPFATEMGEVPDTLVTVPAVAQQSPEAVAVQLIRT
jgi:hypothetical protein